MTPPKTAPETPETAPEATADDVTTSEEAKFWDKLGDVLDEKIKSGVTSVVEEKLASLTTATGRNPGSKNSLPGVLADLLFGKQK
jgi:hypothetical protein